MFDTTKAKLHEMVSPKPDQVDVVGTTAHVSSPVLNGITITLAALGGILGTQAVQIIANKIIERGVDNV